MDNHPDEPGETPMQRVLRMKKAAQAERQTRASALRPERNKGEPKGASKPWMKR